MQIDMQNILIYGINIISIVVILFSLYFNIKRHKNISDLPTTVISKTVKTNNLKKLTKNKYVLSILGGLSLVNIFLPNGFGKFVIPAISLIVATNILIQLFEEIDTFNVSKGEVDLITEFKKKKRNDTLEKAKKREQQLNKTNSDK